MDKKIIGLKSTTSISKRTKINKIVKNCNLNLTPPPDRHQKPLSRGKRFSDKLRGVSVRKTGTIISTKIRVQKKESKKKRCIYLKPPRTKLGVQ
jgi:hypothetical protein